MKRDEADILMKRVIPRRFLNFRGRSHPSIFPALFRELNSEGDEDGNKCSAALSIIALIPAPAAGAAAAAADVMFCRL